MFSEHDVVWNFQPSKDSYQLFSALAKSPKDFIKPDNRVRDFVVALDRISSDGLMYQYGSDSDESFRNFISKKIRDTFSVNAKAD